MKKLISYVENKMLNEALEHIIASTPHIPEHVIRHYYNHALDDSDKSDRMLQFVLKLHKNNSISPEMSEYIKPHMAVVARANLKNRLSGINSLDELQVLTDPHMHMAKTKKAQIDSDMPIEVDTPNITVRRIKNQKAAIKAAILPSDNIHAKHLPKANWCVSLDDEDKEGNGKTYFNHYTRNSNVPMFTIEDKKNKRLHAIINNPETPLRELQYRDEYDKTIDEQDSNPHDDNLHLLSGLYAGVLKKHPELVNHEIGKSLLARPSISLYHNPHTTEEDVSKAFDNEYSKPILDSGEMSGIINHPKFNLDDHSPSNMAPSKLRVMLNGIRTESIANKILSHDHVIYNSNAPQMASILSKVPIHPDILTKVFDTSKKKYDIEDDVYGMARVCRGMLTNVNANAEHITNALNHLKDNELGVGEDNIVKKVMSNPNTNTSHITSLHQIMPYSTGDVNRFFYSIKGLPHHIILSALEKNRGASRFVQQEFPREVATEVINNQHNYESEAVARALKNPNLSFDEVSKHMHTGYLFHHVLDRNDIPQHVIDHIMSNHPDSAFNNVANFHQPQMDILANENINHKIKKEHLQHIVDTNDPHNATFAENILKGKNVWGYDK